MMPKPTQVIAAIRIMWAMLAIGGVMILVPAVVVILAHGGTSVLGLIPFIAAVMVIALLALLIRAVSAGHNWARMLYGAVAVIAIIAMGASFLNVPDLGLIAVLVRIAVIALYVLALYLLFHPASNQWFRSPNAVAG